MNIYNENRNTKSIKLSQLDVLTETKIICYFCNRDNLKLFTFPKCCHKICISCFYERLFSKHLHELSDSTKLEIKCKCEIGILQQNITDIYKLIKAKAELDKKEEEENLDENSKKLIEGCDCADNDKKIGKKYSEYFCLDCLKYVCQKCKSDSKNVHIKHRVLNSKNLIKLVKDNIRNMKLKNDIKNLTDFIQNSLSSLGINIPNSIFEEQSLDYQNDVQIDNKIISDININDNLNVFHNNENLNIEGEEGRHNVGINNDVKIFENKSNNNNVFSENKKDNKVLMNKMKNINIVNKDVIIPKINIDNISEKKENNIFEEKTDNNNNNINNLFIENNNDEVNDIFGEKKDNSNKDIDINNKLFDDKNDNDKHVDNYNLFDENNNNLFEEKAENNIKENINLFDEKKENDKKEDINLFEEKNENKNNTNNLFEDKTDNDKNINKNNLFEEKEENNVKIENNLFDEISDKNNKDDNNIFFGEKKEKIIEEEKLNKPEKKITPPPPRKKGTLPPPPNKNNINKVNNTKNKLKNISNRYPSHLDKENEESPQTNIPPKKEENKIENIFGDNNKEVGDIFSDSEPSKNKKETNINSLFDLNNDESNSNKVKTNSNIFDNKDEKDKLKEDNNDKNIKNNVIKPPKNKKKEIKAPKKAKPVSETFNTNEKEEDVNDLFGTNNNEDNDIFA